VIGQVGLPEMVRERNDSVLRPERFLVNWQKSVSGRNFRDVEMTSSQNSSLLLGAQGLVESWFLSRWFCLAGFVSLASLASLAACPDGRCCPDFACRFRAQLPLSTVSRLGAPLDGCAIN
jgi:hypothetical protein